MPDAFERLLAGYDPEIRSIAKKLRDLVRKAAPGAEERVHPGWRNVAWYRNGMFCYIQPQRNWVNIGFNRGAELDGPLGTLEGSGKGMRHIKVRSLRELPARAVTQVTKRASALQAESPKVKIRRPLR
jgi:hypothetical protein